VPLTKKQLECVVMLSDGMRQAEVADALGITSRTVQRWQLLPEFSQALKAAEAGQKASQVKVITATHAAKDTLNRREEMRSRELELLDNLQAFLLEDLQENKNHRSIDRLIKISERRSKLLGLDIRNYPVLEALELLLSERIATTQHAQIVLRNLEHLESELIEHGIVE
jgi:transcriptional regulator with XRE-family HTH domain